MKLKIYKGFNEEFLSQINIEPLIDNDYGEKLNVLGFNSKRFGREMVYFDLLMGQTYVRETIMAGKSAQEISAMWQDDVKRFKEQRRPYLLYDE